MSGPAAFVLAVVLVACRAPPSLFACQKACDLPMPPGPAPLVVRVASDLARLSSGVPHKYVVTEDGALVVAAMGLDVPKNPFHHPVLARGRPIRTGGAITVRHDGGRIAEVKVSQETYAYCATFESLAAAEDALARTGVDRALVRRLDRSPRCAPKSA
jgi:hypothetical protein